MAKTEKMEQTEKRFSREALLKSKRFSDVQQDFLQAILTEESYTMAEAEAAVKKVMGGKE